jgi:hypothetical protein
MAVYRINKTRLAELVDKTIKYVVEADLKDVTSIRNSAFLGCSSLTSITIPSSVTSIGGSAFQSCSSLANVIMKSTTPPIIESSTFSNSGITATTGEIQVPFSFDHSILNAYKTATNWSNYADIISEATPAIEF